MLLAGFLLSFLLGALTSEAWPWVWRRLTRPRRAMFSDYFSEAEARPGSPRPRSRRAEQSEPSAPSKATYRVLSRGDVWIVRHNGLTYHYSTEGAALTAAFDAALEAKKQGYLSEVLVQGADGKSRPVSVEPCEPPPPLPAAPAPPPEAPAPVAVPVIDISLDPPAAESLVAPVVANADDAASPAADDLTVH